MRDTCTKRISVRGAHKWDSQKLEGPMHKLDPYMNAEYCKACRSCVLMIEPPHEWMESNNFDIQTEAHSVRVVHGLKAIA